MGLLFGMAALPSGMLCGPLEQRTVKAFKKADAMSVQSGTIVFRPRYRNQTIHFCYSGQGRQYHGIRPEENPCSAHGKMFVDSILNASSENERNKEVFQMINEVTEMRVKVEGGYIIATASCDPEYPVLMWSSSRIIAIRRVKRLSQPACTPGKTHR